MPGVIGNTIARFPWASAFDSVPSRPSKLPDFGYKNPSMWSKERFSSITSTTWSIESRPATCTPIGNPAANAVKEPAGIAAYRPGTRWTPELGGVCEGHLPFARELPLRGEHDGPAGVGP